MAVAFLVSLLAIAAFGIALWKSDVVPVAHAATSTAFSGLSAMMNPEFDDDAKEKAVRRAAFSLLKSSLSLAVRLVIVLAAAAIPILVADLLGVAEAGAVSALMLRLDYIVLVSVAAIVITGALRRRRHRSESYIPEMDQYSASDRLIHAVAFASPGVQKVASWLDDRLMSGTAVTPSAPPIFVTSLARGGTTALLNALHDLPGIATHTYRDMPFITAPSLWNRLAGGSKRQVARRQRAHGDGLEIDLDSPEAFEEIIWKMFWPEKYSGEGIEMWRSADRKPEADRFITRHMGKIVAARLAADTTHSAGPAVYCSKNNANIARISYLAESYPDCRIVVPVRRPESHAASLLRQHQNFLKQQAEDPFVRRYMSDIGHFEFGLIQKHLIFPGFEVSAYDTSSPDYWLNYWVHAFRQVREHSSRCLIVLQDDLRTAPVETMTALCSFLELDPGRVDFTAYFRTGMDLTRTDIYDPALLAQANTLYHDLEGRSREQLGQTQL